VVQEVARGMRNVAPVFVAQQRIKDVQGMMEKNKNAAKGLLIWVLLVMMHALAIGTHCPIERPSVSGGSVDVSRYGAR